jgi:hypothetical protein
VGVAVGDGEEVRVGVALGEGEGVAVAVAEGLSVEVTVGVPLGVGVALELGLGVPVAVTLGVADAVALWVGVWLGVPDMDQVGEMVGLWVEVAGTAAVEVTKKVLLGSCGLLRLGLSSHNGKDARKLDMTSMAKQIMKRSFVFMFPRSIACGRLTL